MAKSETEGEQQAQGSAEIILKFQNGETRTYKVSGLVYGDLETGTIKIENENGSKFVFLPNPQNHTGKRKRRLKMLHNL